MFSEIGHLAGISNTDWSWAALLADFNNDGFKDLYVTNGIKRDMTDNDYKNDIAKRIEDSEGMMTLDEVFQMAPGTKLRNYMYQNTGHSQFKNKSEEWGFDQRLNSNGVAYGDLDNDGDLDIFSAKPWEPNQLYINDGYGYFTEEGLARGIENINESPARLDAVKKEFQTMGAEIKEFYLVMGKYDIIFQ